VENTLAVPPGGHSVLVRVTDIRQYAYCPRVVYYTMVVPVPRPVTFKMEYGVDAQQHVEALEMRRKLRRYGLHSGERHFRVDLIVNTGDVTDYGTEVEEAFIQRLRQLPVPQLLVAGNHDSQTTLRTLDREAEMRVLDGESVVVHGVRFTGWPDPVSKRQGYGRVNPSSEDLDRLRKEIRDEVASLPAPPHVLLVHNHRVAEQLGGAAPVILYGHSHRPSVRRTPRSIFINAGTTGGAGARYFEARNGVPYSAVVLHFSREEPGHLLAADLLQVHGPEGEFVLQRHMLNGTTNRDEHLGPAPPPARAGQP